MHGTYSSWIKIKKEINTITGNNTCFSPLKLIHDRRIEYIRSNSACRINTMNEINT